MAVFELPSVRQDEVPRDGVQQGPVPVVQSANLVGFAVVVGYRGAGEITQDPVAVDQVPKVLAGPYEGCEGFRAGMFGSLADQGFELFLRDATVAGQEPPVFRVFQIFVDQVLVTGRGQ